MEIVSTMATKIVDYTIEPVGHWLCYSFHYTSNIGSLKEQVEDLQLASERLQHSVGDALRDGLEIEGDVKKWLEDAAVIIELAGQVVEGEKEEVKTKCYNGACLNLKLKLRHQLSRKAKRMVQEIGELLLKKPSSERVGFRPPPQRKVIAGSTDYVASKSRMPTVTRLMEALKDDTIHLIGVWGMAGVGKSTLLKEIANQAMEEKLFDEVAIANVKPSPDPELIQGEIADMLRLQFHTEKTVIGRANRLRERLTKKEDKKMILVILDDIWKNLDLKEIGIPYEECKVLLASRDREVLVSGMGTQMDFGLEVLDKEEAWSLFEKMAGDCVNKDPNLRSIANEVAEACARLPLALVTVSKALKNKELFEWKDALQLLRRPAPEHLKEMQSTIYSAIELRYKHLESKEVQDVFLLCAQQDYYIHKQDLLKYCYGLGLFHGINTMEDARNRLRTILRILKDCCLLLQSPYSSKGLCMHDIVRDAATLIASRDHNMLVVRADGGLKEWPNADALKRCRALSVRKGDIHEFPKKMECPELRFLYVYGGDHPMQISDTFFQGMEKLNVLDLTKMQLSSLPSSLHFLENLQTLCLDQCVLGDIALIGKLKNLAILSLLKSHISQLPEEIGLLSRLRLLDLSNCSNLKVISPNVLSRLKALEELYMGNSFDQWEAEGLNNASLAELKHLSHLTTLEIQIPNANNLPKDLSFEKLESYMIFVGDEWDWSNEREEASRILKLKLNTSFQSEVGIKMILNRTENLYLDELKGVKTVLPELDWEGFQQLKHLHIQNNPEIKYIMNRIMSVVVFPALETFHLKNMTSLEKICHDQLPNLTISFGKLRVVKVEQCDKLKYFFSSSMARGLSQLEELEIGECSIMGAIVMKEEGEIEETDLILFPKLRCLALRHLPKLISFLSTQNSFITDAGEIISEGNFYMPILHEQVVFPNLERLELSSIHLEDGQQYQHRATSSSYRLENMQSTSRFQNLSHLEVRGSGNIKYLLSFSTVRVMEQLKHLHILECTVMEEIIITEELGLVEERIPKVFRRLECLVLNNLPMLKRFCIGSNIKFPSLKNLRIEHCPKLKTFIFKSVSSGMKAGKELMEMNATDNPHSALQPLFNEEVAFPSLEKLVISHMDDLEIIWHNQFAVDSFCKLQTLKVEFCENLTNYIFQSNMLARFQSLVELIITDCYSLEEVFELQRPNVKETHAVTVLQLEKLYLARLPKLKHVWSKDPQGMFSFQNLKLIQAELCESLKSFFPASIARCLMRLEMLHIVCCMVEEIVAGEEGAAEAEVITRFVFPQVFHLRLDRLPRLKWFYPRRHTSEWPMLKDMWVGCCHQVDIFASKLLSERLKQLIFSVDEATFPNLMVLTLSHRDSIWRHGQLLRGCFGKLQTLGLVDDPTKSIVSLSNFLKGLHNLRFLVVFRNCWEEVFPYEVVLGQENHVWILPQLRVLSLIELPMLTHLWREDTQPCQILHTLKSLDVRECGKLRNLVPSSVSFQNLTQLEILKCHGLINLVTSPTAKSLVQLKKMKVSECESIMEIVTREGGEANDDEVISFSNLKCLMLDCLPRLTNFCSGGYCLELPSLEVVLVRQCQAMKTFSDGDLRIPKLQRVLEFEATKEDEWHWKDDDLNSTIHWPREAILLFKEEGFIIPEKTSQQYVQQLECSFSNSVSVDFSKGAPLPP